MAEFAVEIKFPDVEEVRRWLEKNRGKKKTWTGRAVVHAILTVAGKKSPGASYRSVLLAYNQWATTSTIQDKFSVLVT